MVGCSTQTLRNWVLQSERDDGTRTDEPTTDEKKELAELRRRVRILEQEKEILKKAAAWFAKDALDPLGAFEFIEANRASLSVATMCSLLDVSRSGYYGWRDRPPSKRAMDDEVLTEKIADVYEDSRRTYGYRRVTAELIDEQGEQVGRHRVARLMRKAQLQGVTRRKFCRTTRRDDRARPAPDLLDRDFTATAPDQRWVADITYVPTWAGFLFLATVLDVFTRQVVGWSMSSNQNTELVTRALQMAVRRRRPTGVVVHHSDQGCEVE